MTGRHDTRLLPEGLLAIGYSSDGAILAIDAEVICPSCGRRSSRLHGGYVWPFKEFPAHGTFRAGTLVSAAVPLC